MTTINSFFRILSIAIFCFATTSINAQQVNAQAGFYTTANEYEAAATAGYDNNVVVVFQKPTLEIRVSSFTVSSTGEVTLKDNHDYGAAKKVNVTMLSGTRAAITYVSTTNKHHVAIFDLDAAGDLTLKQDWTGTTDVTNLKPGIARLSSSSFATAIGFSSNNSLRITTFKVAANGTITKKDDDDNGSIVSADLSRMSNGRVVASVKLSATSSKAICFDVNETTQVITRRGDVSLGNTVSKFSSTAFASNMLAIFIVDATNRLDAKSFEVNSSGNFIAKTTLNDLKHTVTGQYYQIAQLDGQMMSSVGKLMLGTSSTNAAGNKLGVIPFNYNAASGAISLLSGGYYPNAPHINYIYSGAANGKLILSSRQMDNKYQIRAFRWGN